MTSRNDDLLGRGAMGEVWRAYDTAHDRDVVVGGRTRSSPTMMSTRKRFRAGGECHCEAAWPPVGYQNSVARADLQI